MSKFKFPTVLTYNKTIQPSTGVFYSLFGVEKDNFKINYKEKKGVVVDDIGIRTSISTYENNPDEITAENFSKSNLQRNDVAALDPESEWLMVEYNLNINNNLTPHSCNDPVIYDRLIEFLESFKSNIGYEELITRYLKNIVNANTMWKNKSFSEECYVEISYIDPSNGCEVLANFEVDFKDDFSILTTNQDEFNKLRDIIVEKMNKSEVFTMNVKNFLKLGKGQEVYPSEEFVEDKDKLGRSKILSSYKNKKGEKIATFHSVKIGNAIRKIDNWHNHESKKRVAVEMYAPDLNFGRILRDSKTNFFTLMESNFDKYEKALKTNKIDKEQINELNYIVACFIRGGLFNGKSEKKETKAKKSK